MIYEFPHRFDTGLFRLPTTQTTTLLSPAILPSYQP